ncbi:MAG: SAM-dependent methyltransferase [Clostridia bacterium]|nr:SAM-dependent methyltransferase [Clostridia bacterium]
MGNEKLCTLDGRLSCAASFVRKDSVVCDVGTDHAYLPVNLIQRGIAVRAVACDINEGPLERARWSAAKYGVTDKIRFVLADGLDGVQPEKDGVNEIIICGMGGELIARIVDASSYTRKPDVRLILQPMTCAPELRQYLWDNGFRILEERLCEAAGKIYTCIHAAYDGEVRTYTPAELILGESNIEKREPLFEGYAKNTIRRLKTQIDGMKKGGLDTAKEEADLASVETAVEGRI